MARSSFALLLLLAVSQAFAQVASLPPEVRKELSAYFEREGPKPGEQAPDFTLHQVAGGEDPRRQPVGEKATRDPLRQLLLPQVPRQC